MAEVTSPLSILYLVPEDRDAPTPEGMAKSNKNNRTKTEGAHFTPPKLARFIASRIINYYNISGKQEIRVLDPACGDGELLEAFAYCVPPEVRSRLALIGIDNNATVVTQAKERLRKVEVNEIDIRNNNFLEITQGRSNQGDLFSEGHSLDPVDIIIANPPYVRTQVLGAEQARQLSLAYNLQGRIDLYQAFLVAMTHVLRLDGIMGVITSNRFLTTKSGASTRMLLTSNYAIEEIYDLGDTKIFQAAVLPAILIAKRKNTGATFSQQPMNKFVRIYESRNEHQITLPDSDFYSILDRAESGIYKSAERYYKVASGTLSIPKKPSDVWSLVDQKEKDWIKCIDENAYCRVGDLVNVRVGIKTTADSVFIRANWSNLSDDARPESKLIRRLLTPEDAQKWRPKIKHNKEKYVLYTHVVDAGRRRAINLSHYPKAARYLDQHKTRLESRRYVAESGRNWYEIWVPQDPNSWNKPKIVWPDIQKEPLFFFDDRGCVVKGNCYWIGLREGQEKDLLFLIQGICNTQLMTRYHDLVFNNKLYAGRRRYLTQYVAKYPIPNPNSDTAKQIVALVKSIVFQELDQERVKQNENQIEVALAKSLGVDPILNERNYSAVESVASH